MTGGNYQFSKIDSSSPTGFYRYHIFTGTSTFTLSHPAPQFLDMQWVLSAGGGSGGPGYSPGGACGGGGGAGGVINGSGPTFGAPAGTYTVTIGAGAARVPYSNHSKSPAYYGTPSSITGSPGTLHSVTGGGSGGSYPQTPTYGYGNPGGSGGGGCGPGYSSWPTHPSYPTQGYSAFPGGNGMPGQGNPGGYGTASYNPNYGHTTLLAAVEVQVVMVVILHALRGLVHSGIISKPPKLELNWWQWWCRKSNASVCRTYFTR